MKNVKLGFGLKLGFILVERAWPVEILWSINNQIAMLEASKNLLYLFGTDKKETYFSKKDDQPGTKPGSRVNQSKVIRMKKKPVTISG